MNFDASTIFVLALTAFMIGWVTWAEMYSRRRHRESEKSAGATAAAPSPGQGAKSRRQRQ